MVHRLTTSHNVIDIFSEFLSKYSILKFLYYHKKPKKNLFLFVFTGFYLFFLRPPKAYIRKELFLFYSFTKGSAL